MLELTAKLLCYQMILFILLKSLEGTLFFLHVSASLPFCLLIWFDASKIDPCLAFFLKVYASVLYSS